MDEEKKALICPFCGGRSHHILGARQTRMLDVVGCLDCFAEIQGTYEPESALIKWNTRAQLPSQGGEAVEVVATVEAYGGKWAGIHWGECIGSTEDPERQLMTVAQHQRIMAAATHPADQVAEGMVVSRELLYRIKNVYAAGLTMDSEIDELRALLEANP